MTVTILLGLAVAAVATTIARGKIFSGLREWVWGRWEWAGELLRCPYCLSHWLAAGAAAYYQPDYGGHWLADWLVATFALVAIANLWLQTILWLATNRGGPKDED